MISLESFIALISFYFGIYIWIEIGNPLVSIIGIIVSCTALQYLLVNYR